MVAVSGGQDSLCLAKLLLDLRSKWKWELAIAHLDHGWRPDSADNALYVEELGRQWQLPFYLRTAPSHKQPAADKEPYFTNQDYPDPAPEPILPKTEALARQWRYQVLGDIAISFGYAYVVTAHTATDCAETLLFNLSRGSGADGLVALAWQRSLIEGVELVRPLLEVTREQTGEFCRWAEISVWEDATNRDLKYSRNRIRQELLPYLARHFNPQVVSHLAQTAELLRADVEYLEAAASKLLAEALSVNLSANTSANLSANTSANLSANTSANTSANLSANTSANPFPDRSDIGEKNIPGHLRRPWLNRRILAKAHPAIQRRAMRQWLQQVTPSCPNFERVEKIVALIAAPNRSRTDPFPGGAIARVEGDWIVFQEPGED